MSGIQLPRRRVLGTAAALAGGALLGSAAPALARGPKAADAPRIYTREEWGAAPPQQVATILDHGPDHLVVHHTASANTTDYSQQAAYALSRSIQDLHMNKNGWGDTGQQLTISRGGFVMEGRNRTLESFQQKLLVLGAQTANENSHTLGIENEGTYISETPPTALWNSLVDSLAYLCSLYGLDPQQAIVGHRDYVQTQCPGDAFYAQLPKLRNDVAGKLGARKIALPPLKRIFTDLPKPRFLLDHGPALGRGERL